MPLILVSLITGSSAKGDNAEDLINKALKVSGIAEQLDLLAATVMGSIPGDLFEHRETRRRVEKYVKDRVKPEDLLASVRAALRRDFSPERIMQVVEFYESRLGRKVGALQSKILTSQAIQDVQEGHSSVQARSETRLALLKAIMDAQNSATRSVALLDHFLKGLADGFLGHGGLQRDELFRTLGPLVRGPGPVNRLTEQVDLVAYARTYRSLTDRELEELAAYHTSESARWFGNAVQAGTEQAVYQVAKALGESLRILRDSPEQDRAISR